jgi:hypothetical protein
MQSWRLCPVMESGTQTAPMLESLQAAGLLCASTSAVLLREQSHMGRAKDTRMAAGHGFVAEHANETPDRATYWARPNG